MTVYNPARDPCMSAEVVPLAPERKPKAVVVGVVNDDPVGLRSLDKRTLAIERCADQIERALRERLTLEQRIGLERALDELVDEVAWRRFDPW
jgi:hypothetical protein